MRHMMLVGLLFAFVVSTGCDKWLSDSAENARLRTENNRLRYGQKYGPSNIPVIIYNYEGPKEYLRIPITSSTMKMDLQGIVAVHAGKKVFSTKKACPTATPAPRKPKTKMPTAPQPTATPAPLSPVPTATPTPAPTPVPTPKPEQTPPSVRLEPRPTQTPPQPTTKTTYVRPVAVWQSADSGVFSTQNQQVVCQQPPNYVQASPIRVTWVIRPMSSVSFRSTSPRIGYGGGRMMSRGYRR